MHLLCTGKLVLEQPIRFKNKKKENTLGTDFCIYDCVYDEHADLREDKHYMADHPSLVPVTTDQVQIFPR